MQKVRSFPSSKKGNNAGKVLTLLKETHKKVDLINNLLIMWGVKKIEQNSRERIGTEQNSRERNGTEKDRTADNRKELNITEQNRIGQKRRDRDRTGQNRTEQSRTEQKTSVLNRNGYHQVEKENLYGPAPALDRPIKGRPPPRELFQSCPPARQRGDTNGDIDDARPIGFDNINAHAGDAGSNTDIART
ncbi:jg15279 [Pararge aegeria aegeria]|uniref:Jg15279 protein n=1 Tax=Pararge aegeria aegeria TaxID=348720 RepID=A0A8S4R600_9NEOP|nr:jg15279 [Pararge aegeria aegeria]